MNTVLSFFGPSGIFYLLGAAIIGALVAYMKGRLSGARLERDKQAKHRLDAIKDRKEVDDEVADLGHADLDDRFKRWLQDNR